MVIIVERVAHLGTGPSAIRLAPHGFVESRTSRTRRPNARCARRPYWCGETCRTANSGQSNSRKFSGSYTARLSRARCGTDAAALYAPCSTRGSRRGTTGPTGSGDPASNRTARWAPDRRGYQDARRWPAHANRNALARSTVASLSGQSKSRWWGSVSFSRGAG